MKVAFFNSSYKYDVKVSTQKYNCVIKNRSTIVLDIDDTDANIEFLPVAKSKFKIPFFDLYLDTTTKEDISGFVVCKCITKINQIGENEKITIVENTSRNDENIYFLSCKPVPNNGEILKMKYLVADKKKTITKYAFHMSLVTGGIPLAFLGLLSTAISRDIRTLFAFIALSTIFTIPGILNQKKFKKMCSDQSVNYLLSLPIEKKHEFDMLNEVANILLEQNTSKPIKIVTNIIKNILR